ncbi:YchJ family metal-binding protein [Kitasatospora sp. NBC_01250]|uniref:YchJ family protein n=1 Tax=Kitasatospora sp. NBC_01250 TaxID=2903571 RepID=UPI002E34CD1D|nr:YchJ family metal-binding protein [Kitasatospora sp. NBC_01250]
MSKRSNRTRPARPAPALAPAASDGSLPCPCGRPASYADCCRRLHRGEAEAATAEQLMRSRFSAFVVHDSAYLLSSWHPRTRPAEVDFDPRLHWQRLDILGSTEGGPFHQEGTVEFVAHYVEGRLDGRLHENSRFMRHEGSWVYLDGTITATD